MKKSFFIIIPIFTFLAAMPFQCAVSRDGGVFKSTDWAENWQQKITIDQKTNISRIDVLSVAVDPKDSQIIYIGTKDSGLYKSTIGGDAWFKVNDAKKALSNKATIYKIVIDPADSNRIYMAAIQDSKGRLFRSEDAGQNWQETYVTASLKYPIYALAVDMNQPSAVYLGTAQGGLLKSDDYGKSWKTIKWFEDIITDIAISPQNSQIVFVGTDEDGIFKTADNGLNWQSFEQQFKKLKAAKKIKALLIDQKNPNIIYCGSEYGLMQSQDNGQTWSEMKIIIPVKSIPIYSLALDPQNSDILYYGAGSNIYQTKDKGLNWAVYELSSKRTVKTIAIDPFDSKIIYIGMSQEKTKSYSSE